MPADSAKPECDQAVKYLQLEGFLMPASRPADRRGKGTQLSPALLWQCRDRWGAASASHERDSTGPPSLKWPSEGLSSSGDNVLRCLWGQMVKASTETEASGKYIPLKINLILISNWVSLAWGWLGVWLSCSGDEVEPLLI